MWGLKGRSCPECGAAFKPSDYEFVPNSVKYACPHCGQSYYGTDEKGHLTPRQFDCVSCGGRCVMDELTLTPGDGVAEERTRPLIAPWHDKRRNKFKRWFYTIGWSLGTPKRLILATGGREHDSSAFAFASATFAATLMVVAGPWIVFGMNVSMRHVSGFGATLFALIIAAVAYFILLFLWAFVAHGLLKITGGTAQGLGTTQDALCWSSGAMILCAVPCFTVYLLPLAVVWWAISATIMTAATQRVHPARAAVCVTLPPVLTGLGILGLFVWMMYTLATFSSSATFTPPRPNTDTVQIVLDGVIDHLRNDGAPDHPLRYVESGRVLPADLQLDDTGGWRSAPTIWLGRCALESFLQLPPEQRDAVVLDVMAANASTAPAQRLGDIVFFASGVSIDAAPAELWLVVGTIDPPRRRTASPAFVDLFIVGKADGTVERIDIFDYPRHLLEQDRVRAAAGLPGLGDPRVATFTPAPTTTAPTPP